MENDVSKKLLPPERGKRRGQLSDMSGRVKLTLLSSLAVLFFVLGFMTLTNRPAHANPTKYKSCTNNGCHVTSLGNIWTSVNGGTPVQNGTTSVIVPQGGSFEVDFRIANQADTANPDSGVMVAVPAGWGVASGTVNSPSGFPLTGTPALGWSSTWDAAAGKGYAPKFSVSGKFPNSPDGYTIDFTNTLWHEAQGAAGDWGQANDLDGTADLMGADAIITVPASTPTGTYTVVTMGAGHNAGTKSYRQGGVTVTVTAAATKTDQTITFPVLPTKTHGDADFSPGATASSGLTVTYSSSNTSVATIVSGQIHIVGAGTATITASQAGDATYNPAPDVQRTLTVNKANQTITFGTLAAKTYGDAPFTLSATASSGLSVSYTSSNPAVATVSGNTVTIVGAGSTTITASQPGNTNYNAAADVPQALTVNKASQTITFGALAAKNYGDAPFTLSATASSGLAVSYTSSNLAVATVSGNTVTIVGVGSTTITASQPGNTNYSAAADVPQTLTVNKASQTITFGVLAAKTYGDAPFALSATASSGLSVSYTSSNPAVATVSGNTVTIVGAGSTTITASQPGDATYAAAADVPQPLTINTRPVTVTADAKTKVVGSADPALTYTITSGSLVGTDAFTGALSRDPGEAIGFYPIRQNTLALNSNYSLTYIGNNLEITAAPKLDQTITFNPLPAKIYGDADFNPGATASSGLPVSYTSSNPAVATIIGGQIHLVGVGTTTITASQVGDVTYNPAVDVSQTLTVNKAVLTVTADSTSKTYGAANPPLGVSYSGFVGTDSASSLTTQPTASTSATAASPAGTYAVTAGGGVSNNYNFNYISGTLTINKALLTVTALNAGKTYGAALPALGVSYAGFVNGDNEASLTTQPIASTTATASSPVGTYPITATGGASSNYNFTYAAGTLTVNKAALTVSANNASKTYGASNPVLSFNYSGFVNGDNEASLTTQPTVGTTAVVGSPVGLYPITVAGGVSSNYDFTYVAGTLTVNKAALTVTATNAAKTYGAVNPSLSVSYTGFVNGDSEASLTTQPTVSTTAIASSPAGTYPITATGGASSNYNFTYVAGTLTVNRAALTVTASNAAKTYGAVNPALSVSYTGFVNGDSEASLTTQPTASTTATASSPAGTYPITATGGASSNYDFTYVAGTLTVDKAALTVTANNAGKTYGAANPALSVAYSGFVLGETATSLTTQPTASTTATVSSPAGTYQITAAGGVSNNYNFTYVAGTLTIDKAALTVTANNASKTYGAANPALTVAYTGFVLGETATNLTTQPVASTTATASSPAGTYPITAADGVSNNYTFTYLAGTLTIDKAALTVTADNAGKTYGAANPALSVAYSGFVLGETAASLTTQPVASTTATASSPAGTYQINAGGGVSNNYNFTYVAGTLTIDKAALTVTANNASKTYGAVNPALTVAYSGFVLGETATSLTTQPVASTTAASSSPAGIYPITAAGGASNNYNFTYVAGTLTIDKAVLTVTADDQSRAVGAPDPVFTATYSGFVNGDTVAVISGAPSFTTTATQESPAGTYPITPALGSLSAANYNFAFVNGTLTVTAGSSTYTLTVATAGAGAGTVNSNPTGIACDGVTGCSYDFASGISVTLAATPDSKSVFAGWSGACTGTGDCIVTMDAAKNVTATFAVNPLVRLGVTFYADIFDAYAAALDGAVIETRDVTFNGGTFNRLVSITIDGGKDAGWNKTTGFSTVTGPITVEQGTVTVDGVSIQ